MRRTALMLLFCTCFVRQIDAEIAQQDWIIPASGSPDRVLLVEFKSEKLKPLTGKTLSEAAKLRGEDPIETIMNLVLEDQSRVGTVYFMMSEDNLRKQIRLPWVSFGSDAASMSPEPPFTKSSAHPRAYREASGISPTLIPSPFHAHQRELAQSSRALLRQDHHATHSTGHV